MAITRIHVGFPKAGSTFLQQYLKAHPNVAYSFDELNNYRNTGMFDLDLKGELDGNAHVISEEQLSIWAGGRSREGLELYNMGYEIGAHKYRVASEISERFSDARILIVVRSPYSLLGSIYSQYLTAAGSFGLKRILDDAGELIFKLYDYEFVITTYQKLFGSENVLVLPFELLMDDHQKFLKTVEQFLSCHGSSFSPRQLIGQFPKTCKSWLGWSHFFQDADKTITY